MDDLSKMQDDMEQAIQNYERKSQQPSDAAIKKPETPPPENLREYLKKLLHSHKFMVAIIVLVVLDCLLVIALLIIDLEIVHLGEEYHYVPKIFHYSSIGILSMFLVEIGLRLYVLRLDFFKHKMEVFDAFIVIVSFILDIVFRDNDDATSGAGLLILLRLWRVARIVNGIVLSVKKQAEEKLEHEQDLRKQCERNLSKCQAYCQALEAEVNNLQRVLKEHDITYTPNTELRVHKGDDE